ncbi:hypothetical protein B4U79_16668 [Dinothrombium tinctorium]|uniref:B30.2/SPRY domain-containing protein n=1 Tax=Dinothrombium tinctorium TaxID=1965070 RepID=A0A3S3NU55_9ACAR|nr:hypothetical protein B4U79_16669 [Dinothrombium tinctorium]RWS01901.1 hypothetical protein B4U79_16668 [Dinothrombium tinctorium]
MTSGKYFWQFKFTTSFTGSVYAGVTSEEYFSPGYGIRGLFYGNTLSSGRVTYESFGEVIRGNDTVDILLDLKKNSLKMYVFHNKHPLGLAFDIKGPYPTPLFPAAIFYNPGEVEITKLNEIPTNLERELSFFTGFEGRWNFESVKYKGKVVSNPGWRKYALDIFMVRSRLYPSKEEKVADRSNWNSYYLTFRIRNRIKALLTKESENNFTITRQPTSLITVHGAKKEAENYVHKLIGDFTRLSFNETTLTLFGNDGLKMTFKKGKIQPPKVITESPFNDTLARN